MIVGTIYSVDQEIPFFVSHHGKPCLRVKIIEVLCDSREGALNGTLNIGANIEIRKAKPFKHKPIKPITTTEVVKSVLKGKKKVLVK